MDKKKKRATRRIYLFWSVIPTNRKTRLALSRPVPTCQPLATRSERNRNNDTQKKKSQHGSKEGENHLHVVRDPTLEHMPHDRSTRIVRITQVQPIRQPNRPSLVVHLVYERTILGRDAKGGDARHPVGVGGGVQRTSGAGTGADGGKVGGRRVGGASGGRRGCQCLVESLANHFRKCVDVHMSSFRLQMHTPSLTWRTSTRP